MLIMDISRINYGGLRVDKLEVAGELQIRGKVVKIKVGDPEDPVRFFCFLDDVEGMVARERVYVTIYKDKEASD
jgi:hypothetical protein